MSSDDGQNRGVGLVPKRKCRTRIIIDLKIGLGEILDFLILVLLGAWFIVEIFVMGGAK